MLGFDPVQFGKAMGEIVHQATEPLRLEIEQLKSQLRDMSSPVEDLTPALEVSDEQIRAVVSTSVERIAMEWLDANRPKDGESVSVDDVMPTLSDLVKARVSAFEDEAASKLDQAIAAIPTPKDGENGTSVTIEDVRVILEAEVAKWALDFERRAQGILERAVANMPKPKDGKDGRDGIDGLCFDDTEIEHDGERGFTVRMSREGRVKEKHIKIPVPIDKGYWKEGFKAEAGDGMTCGGSYWIAKCDTTGKPGVSEDWRLAVKKGRDGKDR